MSIFRLTRKAGTVTVELADHVRSNLMMGSNLVTKSSSVNGVLSSPISTGDTDKTERQEFQRHRQSGLWERAREALATTGTVLKSGVRAFLHKPVNNSQFLAVIRSHFAVSDPAVPRIAPSCSPSAGPYAGARTITASMCASARRSVITVTSRCTRQKS